MKQFLRFVLNWKFPRLINKRSKICVLSFFVSTQIDFSLERFVAQFTREWLET